MTSTTETTEDVMHPTITQATAAERTRDQRARAVARRQVAEIRRSERARRSPAAVRTGRVRRILLAPRAA